MKARSKPITIDLGGTFGTWTIPGKAVDKRIDRYTMVEAAALISESGSPCSVSKISKFERGRMRRYDLKFVLCYLRLLDFDVVPSNGWKNTVDMITMRFPPDSLNAPMLKPPSVPALLAKHAKALKAWEEWKASRPQEQP